MEQRLFELRQKHFTSNFKSYSRDRRNDIFASKTNPPPVGQYHPKKEVTFHKSRSPHFDPHHFSAVEAFDRKFNAAKSSIKICPNVLKFISPQKVSVKMATSSISDHNTNIADDQSPVGLKAEKIDSQVSSDALKLKKSQTLEQQETILQDGGGSFSHKNSRIQAKNAIFFDHIGQEKRLQRNIHNLSKESLGHGTKRLSKRGITRGSDAINSVDYGYKT